MSTLHNEPQPTLVPTTTTTTTTKRRRVVTFPQEEKLHTIFTFESMNKELAKEIFYQSSDYNQFRQEYRAHKRRTLINRMSQQARNDLLMKQQRWQPTIASATSNSLKLIPSSFPVPIPVRSISTGAPQRKNRGCALMA